MVRHCGGQRAEQPADSWRKEGEGKPASACKKCVDTVKSDQCHRAAERDDDFVYRIVFCLARVMGKK